LSAGKRLHEATATFVAQGRDTVCSSSNAGCDALTQIYHQHCGERIEVADAAMILARWL
jgi:hypothetical protein